MKKSVLALILLLIALPVLSLAGCTTVSDVNRGDVRIVMAIPEEFEAFENDVTLDEIVVVAKKDSETHTISAEVINGTHGEVMFEFLTAGAWNFTIEVTDLEDNVIFTANEVVSVVANTTATESISLTMSRASLTVSVSLPDTVNYASGSVELLNFDGNGNLTRSFEITSFEATTKFSSITPKICNITFTLLKKTGEIYTGSRDNVKILPGQSIREEFDESDLTLVVE